MFYDDEEYDVVSNSWIKQSCGLPSLTHSQSFLALPEISLQPSVSTDMLFLSDYSDDKPEDLPAKINVDDVSQTEEILMRPYSSGNEKDMQLQKRSRHEVHSISERVKSTSTILLFLVTRRRSRINGKLKTLQGLMPHCKKKDRASILDEAAKYIRALQHQIQTMTKLSKVEYIAQSQYMPCFTNPGLQYPYAPMPQVSGMCVGCYSRSTPFFQVPSPSSTMANFCVPSTRPLHGN